MTAPADPEGEGRERRAVSVSEMITYLKRDVAANGTAHRIDAAYQELLAWLPYIKRRNRRAAYNRLRDLERLARELVEEACDGR